MLILLFFMRVSSLACQPVFRLLTAGRGLEILAREEEEVQACRDVVPCRPHLFGPSPHAQGAFLGLDRSTSSRVRAILEVKPLFHVARVCAPLFSAPCRVSGPEAREHPDGRIWTDKAVGFR